MARLIEPTYITPTEFKANTRVVAQQTLLDDPIKDAVAHAEWIIDSLTGFVDSFDSFPDVQSRKFPIRNSLNVSEIPTDLKKACVEIASDIILKGEPVISTGSQILGEAWSGSGYNIKYSDPSQSGKVVEVEIPPIASQILKKYRTGTARLTY